MSHSLPESDFRAFRVKLDPDDFALSYGPDPPPSDLIPEDVWHSIQDLPSDVSIRTSDHHGTKLKGIHELLGFWISEVIEAGNLLDDVFLDANEEFQAAEFNLLHGFYRPAISCLRSALEIVNIGCYCQMSPDKDLYNKWRQGIIDLDFNTPCNFFDNLSSLTALKTHLKTSVSDSLFTQKTPSNPGGYNRRLYSELSKYSHTYPGFANGDFWNSNGPIYATEAFEFVSEKIFSVYELCLILLKILGKDLVLTGDISDFIKVNRTQEAIVKESFSFLDL